MTAVGASILGDSHVVDKCGASFESVSHLLCNFLEMSAVVHPLWRLWEVVDQCCVPACHYGLCTVNFFFLFAFTTIYLYAHVRRHRPGTTYTACGVNKNPETHTSWTVVSAVLFSLSFWCKRHSGYRQCLLLWGTLNSLIDFTCTWNVGLTP